MSFVRIAVHRALAAASAAILLSGTTLAAEQDGGPADARVAAGIVNTSLSRNGPDRAASVPEIAIDPRNPDRIAVIWRFQSMDKDASHRAMECRLSLSKDGGWSFSEQLIQWGMPETPKCNAPYVDIGREGEIIIGATLAGDLPQNAPPDAPHLGSVVFRKSTDDGRSWTPTKSVIATGDEKRFASNPAVPEEAKRTPWDGARGVVDAVTGTIVVSGGFPAPPGGALHSQRFYSISTDGGATWGAIHAFGAPGWPQRWDGHMIAANGQLAFSYLADAVPASGVTCLCVVFAVGPVTAPAPAHHLVMQTDHFDTLVHYPPIAAQPGAFGVYALAMIETGGSSPVVMLTVDNGQRWIRAVTMQAPKSIARASRPALAYAPDGTLVLMWRGYHADGSYDVYMAAARDGKSFGPVLRASTETSRVPAHLLKDYAVRGDFINVVAAGPEHVHAAWNDWRSGKAGEVYYARVPLSSLPAPTRSR